MPLPRGTPRSLSQLPVGGEKAAKQRHASRAEAVGRAASTRGHRDSAASCKPLYCHCFHRILSGLSQTNPSPQHVGLSRTVRLYPTAAARGQLTSNALPAGPGLERRDGAQPAAYPNHLSSPWGKNTLSQGPRRAGHLHL